METDRCRVDSTGSTPEGLFTNIPVICVYPGQRGLVLLLCVKGGEVLVVAVCELG